MKLRLYWLGPATEPGVWGIDSGIGTPIWRIHSWEMTGLVRPEHLPANTPPDHPRPRGWINIYDENGITIHAPEETRSITRAGLHLERVDPIKLAYTRYARPAF
jgi:hypothetical protein